MPGDHDIVSESRDVEADLGHRCRAVCRCGLVCHGPTRDAARARHETHWRAESFARDGIAAARAALEKGRGDA